MPDFINFTPHSIMVRTETGDIVIAPSGEVARVVTDEVIVADLDGIPVIKRCFGTVSIPAIPEGHYAIVSSMVLDAAKVQKHYALDSLLAPDTGATAIREGGQVKAVTRLVCA